MVRIITIVLFIFACLVFPSCKSHLNETSKEQRLNDIIGDTAKAYVNYKNVVFCIPSPQLVNLYLKQLGIYPITSAVNPILNNEKYSTSAKKALNLGVYGADLGYMNLFAVSENTNQYVMGISKLSNDIGLGVIFNHEVYQKIISLKNDEDSLATYLSQIFFKADEYFNSNAEQQVSSLVIAGGWIESFYLMCFTYTHYKNEHIKNLILQQKFSLENLIKTLAPYYETSPEMKELIDNLVDIAYDYDMLDFKYIYKKPVYEIKNNIIVFKNTYKVGNSDQLMKIIVKKTFSLREKIIN